MGTMVKTDTKIAKETFERSPPKANNNNHLHCTVDTVQEHYLSLNLIGQIVYFVQSFAYFLY